MARITTVIDDLTGQPVTESEVSATKVKIGQKDYTLDLSAASTEALTGFLSDPVSGRAVLAALFAPAPQASTGGRKRGPGKPRSLEGDGAKAKAWARTQPGMTVKDRGKPSNEMIEAWKAAGSPVVTDSPAPAPAPAPAASAA